MNKKTLKYPNLFSPIQIGSLTVKNRIESSASGMDYFDAREHLTQDNIAYYRLKAKGGAGIVTIGESLVHTPTGHDHYMIRLDDPLTEPMLTMAADVIHQYGAAASIQLSHGGAHCNKEFLGQQPMGPSPMINQAGDEVRAMTEEEIETVIEAFGNAALRCKNCGFDMVQVHGGHGWLLSQFISPLINKRTDKWGGSLENRMRFPLMVIERIREKCGADFPIEFRMSGEELEPGYDLEEGIRIAKMLDDKIDLLNISIGNMYTDPFGKVICSPMYFDPQGRNVYLAKAIKPHIRHCKVGTVGGITDPEMMEEIIASGTADMVIMARALLADPYLPKKAKAGNTEDIRPCMRCLGCLGEASNRRLIRCDANPVISRERFYDDIGKAENRRKVLVIGGGPGGMQAAITAYDRGHEVILCEKSQRLGGQLCHADAVPFKSELRRFRDYLICQVNKRDIDLRLGCTADKDLIDEIDPDLVIGAIGAAQVLPPLPGVEGKNVVLATHLYDEGVQIGDKVVVIGAGSVGCEVGIHMDMLGKHMEILEMADDFMIANYGSNRRIAVEREFSRMGYSPKCGVKVMEITSDGVKAVDAEGQQLFFPADTVVIATGLKPLKEERESLRAACDEFVAVGDCKAPRLVAEAVREGFFAAVNMD